MSSWLFNYEIRMVRGYVHIVIISRWFVSKLYQAKYRFNISW